MKLNQKGFGLVEGLLVVIALTLIVGVGFYVVNANKDKKDDTKTSQNSTPTESKPTETKKETVTFEFEKLKVTVPKDSVKDLIYTKKTVDNGGGAGYDVATQEFKSLATQCGETVPTGVVLFAQQGQYPGQGNEGFNGLIKQFKSSYVAYGDGLYGSIGCSDAVYGQLSDTQQKIADTLKSAFANAQEVQ